MTPYCSRDQWAVRKSSKTQTYDDWDDYAAAESWPDQNALDEALQDATDIMNDSEHLNAKSINVTNTDYTPRLERICYNMSNRILGTEGNQAMQGGIWTYSPGDKLNRYERQFLLTTSIELGLRVIGAVG